MTHYYTKIFDIEEALVEQVRAWAVRPENNSQLLEHSLVEGPRSWTLIIENWRDGTEKWIDFSREFGLEPRNQ